MPTRTRKPLRRRRRLVPGPERMEDRRLLSGLINTFPVFADGGNVQGPVLSGPGDRLTVVCTNGVVTEFSTSGERVPFGSGLQSWQIQDGVIGPDGNPWFVGLEEKQSSSGAVPENVGWIIHISPDGLLESEILTGAPVPTSIATGPDGNFWVTAMNSRIARVTPDGQETDFSVPSDIIPGRITAGPDGNLWFIDKNIWYGDQSEARIGRMTTSGAVSTFAVPNTKPSNGDITSGPDGSVWFTGLMDGRGEVSRISPSGQFTQYALPAGHYAKVLTLGPDGNLWFTEETTTGPELGRLTTDGYLTEFTLPPGTIVETPNWGPAMSPGGLTTGPDGNLWFALGHIHTDQVDEPDRLGQFVLSKIPSSIVPTGIGPVFSGPVAVFQTAALNPSAGDFQATIDWGDNSPETPGEIVALPEGGFQVVGTHAYASAGSYPISVTILGEGEEVTVSGSETSPATAVVGTSGSVVGGLDPASDTGAPGDGITSDSQPVFSGTTMQNARVQLFARTASSPELIFLGQTVADARGSWRIASGRMLGDGPYDVEAIAAGPAGVAVSSLFPNAAGASLVIDTVGPEVRSVVLWPSRGRVVARFSDAGSGLAPGGPGNVGSYTLVGPASRRFPTIALGGASLVGPSAVSLSIRPGQHIGHGRYVLQLSAAGITDRAGNPLVVPRSRPLPRFGPMAVPLATDGHRPAFWHARRFRSRDAVPAGFAPSRRVVEHRRPVGRLVKHVR